MHADPGLYSKKGLRYISSGLTDLLPVEEKAFKFLKNKRGQHLLPAALSPTTSRFVPSGDKTPSYYLFTGSDQYAALPENMDVTLRAAALLGVEVPLHGLLNTDTESWVLFVKNPAAYSKNRFHPVQSLRALADIGHQPQIDLENVANTLKSNVSFPVVENIKLLRLAIAVYLLGDSGFGPDQLSILDEKGQKKLSPVGDIVNLAMYNGDLEMHLRLDGKTSQWSLHDLLDGFGKGVLHLPEKTIYHIAAQFKGAIRNVFSLIETCYLPDELKEEYLLTIDNKWSELKM
jgi:serine/threonine-protein kinase HipA